MIDQLRLTCVLAHPDDESLGTGGILARYAAEGVETSVVTATRGERGWQGDEGAYPGPAELGRIREGELRAAVRALGVAELSFLDHVDGDLDDADPAEVLAKIVGHIRRLKPHVVVTFDPFGAYGHTDHIAISQLTTAAVVAAADAGYGDAASLPPHRVAKLYFRVWSERKVAAIREVAGDRQMLFDGVPRGMIGWPDWSVTTRIDLSAVWERLRAAIDCHQTQLPGFAGFDRLSPEQHARLWAFEEYYRAFSLVNGGRAIEDDLFAGLR